MFLLDNPIRPYAWGSKTAIAALRGVEPSGEPEAELWMGAHPGSPSAVVTPDGTRSLLDLITAAPEAELGTKVYETFGARLPFLLKVLAADRALSLQAHPDPEQARAGYAAENAAGIPLDAPHRNYKDADAKPELITALTPFTALVGFRPPDQTLAVIDRLGVPELSAAFGPLRDEARSVGIERVFSALLNAAGTGRSALVEAVVAACRARPDDPDARLVLELAAHYPDDIGVVVALLLNRVELRPGEATYLPAGNLHAYVRGLGVEILANSDNVLRGGLTVKHIDVPELTKVLDFTPATVAIIQPIEESPAESVFPTPAAEFRLSRIVVDEEPVVLSERGPQVLLCIDGTVRASGAESVALGCGQSAYAGAGDGAVTLSGRGIVFRATAGL